jgi:hypothetical protein
MKVRELIDQLISFNMDADVNVIVHCMPEEFSLSYGGGDGVEKHNCETVNFYVDRLCTNEKSK